MATVSENVGQVANTQTTLNIDGLLQDSNISSVLAVEILHSCTNPSTYPSNGKLLYILLQLLSIKEIVL